MRVKTLPAMHETEPTESELLHFRRAKLEELQKRGIAAFGGKFEVSHDPGSLRAQFIAGEVAEGTPVRIAGRVLSRRDMGKATFFDLGDISGRIQCYLSKGDVGDEAYDLFNQQIDIGDFVGLEGKAFDDAIAAVCGRMKADKTKHRVTFYYLLAETAGKLKALV